MFCEKNMNVLKFMLMLIAQQSRHITSYTNLYWKCGPAFHCVLSMGMGNGYTKLTDGIESSIIK